MTVREKETPRLNHFLDATRVDGYGPPQPPRKPWIDTAAKWILFAVLAGAAVWVAGKARGDELDWTPLSHEERVAFSKSLPTPIPPALSQAPPPPPPAPAPIPPALSQAPPPPPPAPAPIPPAPPARDFAAPPADDNPPAPPAPPPAPPSPAPGSGKVTRSQSIEGHVIIENYGGGNVLYQSPGSTPPAPAAAPRSPARDFGTPPNGDNGTSQTIAPLVVTAVATNPQVQSFVAASLKRMAGGISYALTGKCPGQQAAPAPAAMAMMPVQQTSYQVQQSLVPVTTTAYQPVPVAMPQPTYYVQPQPVYLSQPAPQPVYMPQATAQAAPQYAPVTASPQKPCFLKSLRNH